MNENQGANQIKLGALFSYITIFVNLVFGLIYAPWMIAKIGQSDYALYVLVNSLIAIFLLDLGLSNAVTRFTCRYLVEGNDNKIPELLGAIFKIYCVMASLIGVMFIVYFFYIDNIYVNLSLEELARFKVVYIILACGSILSFLFTPLEGIMTAYERFVSIQLIKLITKISNVLLIAVCLIVGKGLYALVTINVLCNLAAIVWRLHYINRSIKLKINWKAKQNGLIKKVFSYSLWITAIQFAERFYVSIIPTLLGIVSGSKSIAIFGIASTLESYGFTFAKAFINLFFPKVTRVLTADNSLDRLLELMVKVGRIQAYIIGLIVCGFISVGKDFIYLWVGNAYEEAYLCAVLLLIPIFLTHTQGIASLAMQVQNKLKWQVYVYYICAALNICLALILGKHFGAIGACIGLMIANICKTILIDIIYNVVLKIDILVFFRQCFASMVIPYIITGVFGVFIATKLPTGSWLWFGGKCCIICVCYFISMWYLSMDKYEKGFFRRVFNTKGKKVKKHESL